MVGVAANGNLTCALGTDHAPVVPATAGGAQPTKPFFKID